LLCARILREVINPYTREHSQGMHGPLDPVAAMTITLVALAKAMVPTLVHATDVGNQQAVIDQLVALINEQAADWRAHMAIKQARSMVQ
jgi:hypothetical protein